MLLRFRDVLLLTLLEENYQSVKINALKHTMIIGRYRVIQKSCNPQDNITYMYMYLSNNRVIIL